MSCGALVIDTQGDVVEMNDTAGMILQRELTSYHPSNAEGWSRNALKSLLARAGTRFRVDHESWITVQDGGASPLVLHAIPIVQDEESSAGGIAHTMLVMVDLQQPPKPGSAVLQRLFSLTRAEVRLAIEIGLGRTLQEVSEATGLSNATLRSQLSAIFNKTGTRRQPELVALLARVAILP